MQKIIKYLLKQKNGWEKDCGDLYFDGPAILRHDDVNIETAHAENQIVAPQMVSIKTYRLIKVETIYHYEEI